MPGAFLWGWDATNEVWVKCVVNADGKLIINPTGFLENPPTEDEDTKAPTSEWAFDHDADPDAHHAKYTDTESRAAINNILNSNGGLTTSLPCNNKGLSKAYSLQLQNSADDIYWSNFYTSSNSRSIRVDCYQTDVGYIGVILTINDGTAYREVIHTATFQTNLALYLEENPTNGVVNKAPTSNWAFDHDADAAAHHAKYTDAEAVWSFYNRKTTFNTGTYTDTSMTGISMIELNTSGGDITLKGLDNGLYGQMVFCVKPTSANDVHIIHNSGDAAAGDKIFTQSAGDESLAAGTYGGFWMIYFGGNWLIGHAVP